VAVAPGDTLWAIAARHLPAGATDAQIAAAWPTWYATNAAVVGPDPDLILPGQVLTVPAEATR
jgi:nucleoid-associated protein YgaU